MNIQSNFNNSMTNLEKCNAGIEYSYADEELIALKTEAIRQCEIFNVHVVVPAKSSRPSRTTSDQ